MAGGALLVQGSIPAVKHSDRQETAAWPSNDGLLDGVCDIHLHCRPDSRERSVDEYRFMQDAVHEGYRAVMFKSNDFSCHDRAYIIRQALPGAECFGSFCMNRVHGDKVNPFAARKAIETSGGLCRCIWMPTLDAAYQYRSEGRKAHEIGVKRIVVTHANSSIWTMTQDQVRRCIDLGAYMEYCYLPCLWGEGTKMPQYKRQTIKEFASFVRIAPTRSFISTDLGQAVMPHPIEGMRDCILKLQAEGIPQSDIDLMVRHNPAMLIGLDK